MGFLRKTVKKIGKAIKKVVKKVGKAFGKLGIVGQIGMMFLMPHLGAMWGNIGSWAAQGSNILQKAVGVIHKAGTAIGNTYRTVTEAIGNGFDRAKNFMKGEGFILSPDRTSIFAKPTDALTDKATNVVTDTATDVISDGTPKGIKVSSAKSTGDFKITSDEMIDINTDKNVQPSILAKVKDKDSSWLDKAKDEALKGSIKGVGDLTRKKIAGTEDIDYRNTYVDVGGMSPISSDRGVYESTDLTQRKIGTNSWQEISQAYAPFVQQGM